MDVGPVGLWTFQLDLQRGSDVAGIAAEIEEMGWGALWVPEAVGREPFTHAAVLLSRTERMVVASGVANVWNRTPSAAAAAQRLLADVSGGRFLMGLGVSHGPLVEGLLNLRYEKPLAKMRTYLDELDDAFSTSPAPPEDPPRVLAALGPQMLRLAAERAWGALTYFVPVEHTPVAREVLGEGPMLLVEQAVVLSTDAEEARAVARKHMQTYLGLPNYRNNLLRLGFTEEDLAEGGSDHLVDALVAWGDVDAVVRRVGEHRAAGADHVCLQVLDPDLTALPRRQWRELAAALVEPKRRPRSRSRATSRRPTKPAKPDRAAKPTKPAKPK